MDGAKNEAKRYLPYCEALEDRSVPALIASQVALTLPVLDGGPGGAAGNEVQQLLRRAAAATPSNDAIIAIVDRGGNILGVRVESEVSPLITGNPDLLAFAVDGAVAKARTAAFFANDTAPLTSRTIQFISQSTITEREVKSNPNVRGKDNPGYGPGFVAPVGLGAHFPPNIKYTPFVDLFAIEHTNRDSILHPGADHLKGTADDIPLPSRFNVDPAFIPAGQMINPPLSYGETILDPVNVRNPAINRFQARGIATLPGGIPLYQHGVLVGGIGVFFPGATGFASEENSALSVEFDPTRPDRTLEAEFMAVAAAGGSSAVGFPVGDVGGVPALPGFDIPGFARIDLAGITLDTIGPGGDQGPTNLINYAREQFAIGTGNPDNGGDLPVDFMGNRYRTGATVPEGWLVTPHEGLNISAEEVRQIIEQGIAEADKVRAQIRFPNDERTRMVFAVADANGNVLGLYRMHDATVFSIDVAVAKARNTAYYDDPDQLQAIDQVMGVPAGASLTNRTFRFLAGPRFPSGIDGMPGPFSILNDPGIDPRTGLNTNGNLPASFYTSVLGFDSFNPGSNFRDPGPVANQNGIVFFPGSSGVYKTVNGRRGIVGGFGVSGDGVDQDDVVTSFGIMGFGPPDNLRADQFFVSGVRLPFIKFPRNPEA